MLSGERIKKIRKMRSLTQKELGLAVGFDEATADIRIAQYESNNRTPKANLLNEMAEVLEVSPYALGEPQIETKLGLFHTLFAIEDLYGLEVKNEEGNIVFSLPNLDAKHKKALIEWIDKKQEWEDFLIDEEEYNLFRYSFENAEDKIVKEKPVIIRKPKKEKPEEKKDEYWLL